MDSRPTTPVEIDQNHAHVSGLQAAYIFNNTCKDYRGNFNLNPVTGTYDTGLRTDANGEYANLDNTAQVVGPDVGTIVLKFTSDSAFTDSATRNLFGSWFDTSSTVGDFSLVKIAGNILLFYIFDIDYANRHHVYLNPASIPNWQTGTQISILYDKDNVIYDSKNMAFNIDGSFVTPSGSKDADGWGTYTVNDLYVGNNKKDTNEFANGVIEYLYIYNTVLSAATLTDIYGSPYAMFKAKSLSIFIPEKPTETPAIEIPIDHEHTEGLKAAYLFNESGGKVFDWTQNQNDLSITNASWVADGLQIDADGEYTEFVNSKSAIQSNAGSLLFRIKPNTIFADGVRHVLIHYINGSNQFLVYKHTTNILYFALYDGVTSRYIGIYPMSEWSVGEILLIGIHWDSQTAIVGSDKIAISANGVYLTPFVSSNSTAVDTYDFASTWYFFDQPGSSNRYLNGIVENMNFYDKVPSESTLKSIYEDPYSMFKSRSALYLALMGSYKSALKTKNIYYGANAFPIGRGL